VLVKKTNKCKEYFCFFRRSLKKKTKIKTMNQKTVQIKKLLENGLEILRNVDNPTAPQHRTLEYCDNGYISLKQAGEMVYEMHPSLNGMIEFVHQHVDEKHHGRINHAFSGIGEWQC